MGKIANIIKERNRSVKPRKVVVPELGTEGDPLEAYMHPLTLIERTEVHKLALENDLRSTTRAVRLSARDANGSKLFDVEDEEYLNRAKDPAIIAAIIRMGQAIASDLIDGSEELGENLPQEIATIS